MKKVTAWQCSFCGFYKKTKKSVMEHEERCYLDPEKRACATCVHNLFSKDYFETEKELTNNYCYARDVYLLKKNLRINCSLWGIKNKV